MKTSKTKNMSQRLGIFSKSMTDFLYMKEDERKEKYGYDANQYYGRIVEAVNNSFQDIQRALIHLPDNQKAKIDWETGLRGIQKQMKRNLDPERIPHLVLDDTVDKLTACLEIIKKESNQKVSDIAESDFRKVRNWLEAFQKYPKSIGA